MSSCKITTTRDVGIGMIRMTVFLSISEWMRIIHGLSEALRWMRIFGIFMLLFSHPMIEIAAFETHGLPQLRILAWYFFDIVQILIRKSLICIIFEMILCLIVGINKGELIWAFFKIDRWLEMLCFTCLRRENGKLILMHIVKGNKIDYRETADIKIK